MAKDFTIHLGVKGERLTVSALVDALEKAMELLRTLDPHDQWEVVTMTKQSPVKIVVRNPNAKRIAPAYMRDIRKLDRKPRKKQAANIATPTIVATRDFSDVLNEEFSFIRLSYPGQPSVEFTPQVVQNVRRQAKDATDWQYEWTSIRGLLYQITWNNGQTRCRIRESLQKREIPCNVTPELLETVKDALPHRVDLYGRVKFNRVAGVASIDVEKIEILPENERSMRDTPATNITGGMDSADYIAGLRSAK